MNEEKTTIIRQRSKDYPAVSINVAIEFVKKFKDYPMKKPISKESAAKTFNVKPSTKSFSYAFSSARQFGLIEVSGKNFFLSDVVYRIIRPTESQEIINELMRECFKTPSIYCSLVEQYEGKELPSLETLKNVLTTYYYIAPAVSDNAAKVFLESANQVGMVKDGLLVTGDSSNNEVIVDESATHDKKINDTNDPIDVLANNTQNNQEFSAPLIIPFGDKRRAILYMPINTEKEEAQYVIEMIQLMFNRVYKVSQ